MAKTEKPKYRPTEQISERTENVKSYLVGPGRHHAFAASIPLHTRQEDGPWTPVDAEFRFDKASSGYISHGSRFTAACSVPGPNITVTDRKGHSLSWRIEGTEPVEPEIPEREKPETKDPAEAMFLEAMLQAQGSLVYRNVFPGVDLKIHADDRFKDEFVFREPSSGRPVVFHIETALRPLREKDGSVRLTDENEETVFILLPPAMWDAQGTEGAVSAGITPSGTGFSLSYTPDPAFMGSAVYPVTITLKRMQLKKYVFEKMAS